MSGERSAGWKGRHRGFTLIELMVVITLMGLIAAAVAINVVGVSGQAHVDRARIDFKEIASAIDVYRIRHATLPASLQALVDERMLRELPRDPWGEVYSFERVSDGPDGFRLTTLGADRAPGGTGANADLHSDDADAVR